MSVEIAWKQNILVTDFHLLKSLLVVFGFGSQAFVCGLSRQNINSVLTGIQAFLNWIQFCKFEMPTSRNISKRGIPYKYLSLGSLKVGN